MKTLGSYWFTVLLTVALAPIGRAAADQPAAETTRESTNSIGMKLVAPTFGLPVKTSMPTS